MGLNRILMKANGSTIEGDGKFIMTMGQQSGQLGYSRYNGNYGEVTGNVKHDGKAVTLAILSYYGGYLDFAFNIEGVSGGKYNISVKVTSMDTGASGTIEFPNMQYQSSVHGFYDYTQSLTSDVIGMFSVANVGKKFKVEIIFN